MVEILWRSGELSGGQYDTTDASVKQHLIEYFPSKGLLREEQLLEEIR